MKYGILAATALVAGVVGLAQAQTAIPVPADQIIANRKAGQDMLLGIAGSLKAAVDTKLADVKPYKNAGDGIAAWMKVFPSQFPPGTDKGNTKALPTVWTDRAGFERNAAALAAAGQQIAKAAEANDTAAFAAAFQTASQVCGDCHRTYRAK